MSTFKDDHHHIQNAIRGSRRGRKRVIPLLSKSLSSSHYPVVVSAHLIHETGVHSFSKRERIQPYTTWQLQNMHSTTSLSNIFMPFLLGDLHCIRNPHIHANWYLKQETELQISTTDLFLSMVKKKRRGERGLRNCISTKTAILR